MASAPTLIGVPDRDLRMAQLAGRTADHGGDGEGVGRDDLPVGRGMRSPVGRGFAAPVRHGLPLSLRQIAGREALPEPRDSQHVAGDSHLRGFDLANSFMPQGVAQGVTLSEVSERGRRRHCRKDRTGSRPLPNANPQSTSSRRPRPWPPPTRRGDARRHSTRPTLFETPADPAGCRRVRLRIDLWDSPLFPRRAIPKA